MCGTFVDEVPQDFHRERKAVYEKLLEATEQALPIVQALTADDATADLNQEAVEQLMAVFQDRVTNAMAQEERIHPAALHEWLREAIVSVMEQSPTSPAWGFVPTAMVARGRSPGRHKGKGKGKAKAKGKPQAPEQQPTITAEPEFYCISDPLGADTFLGSRDPELDADYREAILLESFRADSELHDPFPGDSSDDGAPGSYNVEELDEALERQAAEDEAQRELDEAFDRARQQAAGEEGTGLHYGPRVCFCPNQQASGASRGWGRNPAPGLSSTKSSSRSGCAALARTDGPGPRGGKPCSSRRLAPPA